MNPSVYNQEQFYNSIAEYMELYEKGLKKLANKSIAESMIKFDTLDISHRENIVAELCRDFYDENKQYYALMSRGNGDIPFELSKRVCSILKSFCDKNAMPYLRWYYQLCRDFDALKRAYDHPDCDSKTVELYFGTQIATLYWGAHHFTEGCLITQEGYNFTIDRCNSIIEKHEIPYNLLEDFEYYRHLYTVWWIYWESDKSKDFESLCEKNGLNFSEGITIYYNK